jgi:hypothetical protein
MGVFYDVSLASLVTISVAAELIALVPLWTAIRLLRES